VQTKQPPAAVIQRHPIVNVQVTGRTHLRESFNGQSLARGTDYAEVEYPARVTIDKGDIWDSHLGMNLKVMDSPEHVWYRVVAYDSTDLRHRDVYVRAGMFKEPESTADAVPRGFVRVIRFCDSQRPETLWSPDSQNKKRKRANFNWRTDKIIDRPVLARALAHMDGATADSPFVSVATSEADLLQFGFSGGLKDIMFGVDDPNVHAPNIGEFLVPAESLVTPELIAQHVRGAKTTAGYMRAAKETECLYFGDDIRLYLRSWKANPHNKDAFEKMISAFVERDREQQLREEARTEKVLAQITSSPRNLNSKIVMNNWVEFGGIVNLFRARKIGVWQALDALTAESGLILIGRALRPLDSSLMNDPALREEWLQATVKFRAL
jgi:hypothetical protein